MGVLRGELLRKLRLAAGLTQPQLAVLADISVRALRDMEQGRVTRPHPGSLQRLASALDLDETERLALLGRSPAARQDLVSIGVLGPLTVSVRGVSVPTGSLTQQRLIGLLALESDRLVTVEEIADVLWDEQPPQGWRNRIHVQVSQLRKLLQPRRSSQAPGDVIQGHGGAYRLALPDGSVDASRFLGLLTAARKAGQEDKTAEAFSLYQEALACWRGPVLAGSDGRVSGRPAADALRRERLAAACALADLAVEVGQQDQAVMWLQQIAADDPLHEGVHSRLIVALAGAGQQDKALRLYRDLRKRLSDELGVDPAEETQAAYRSILGQGTVAARVRRDLPKPAQLPMTTSFFAGRDAATARLVDHLRGAPRSAEIPAPRIVVVHGMPGVGKTELALHVAHRIRQSYPDGQLFADLQGEREYPMPVEQVLSSLLRSLGVPAPEIPPDVADRAALLRSSLAGRRVLMVLDDAKTSDQLLPLLPADAGNDVIITSRNPLVELPVTRYLLEPLPIDGSLSVLAQLIGADEARVEPAAAARIAAFCAGLPLALRIAAARLITGTSAEDLTRTLDDSRHRLSELHSGQLAVRSSLESSQRGLSDQAQVALRRLAALPTRAFPAWSVHVAMDVPPSTGAGILAELASAHLVTPAGKDDQRGHHHLHDLVRLHALDQVTKDDLAAVEDVLIHWFHLGSVASHPLSSRALPANSLGIPAAKHSTDAAMADPAGWFEREHRQLIDVLRHCTERGNTRLAAGLLNALGPFLRTRYLTDEWRQCVDLVATRSQGNDDQLAWAFALESDVRLHLLLANVRDALPLAEQALARFELAGDRHGHVQMLYHLQFIQRRIGYTADAVDTAGRVLRGYQDLGDVLGQAVAHQALGVINREYLKDLDQAQYHLEQALGLAAIDTTSTPYAQISFSLASLYVRQDRHEKAEPLLRRGLELMRANDNPVGTAAMLNRLGDVLAAQDRYDDAAEVLHEALAMARQTGQRDVHVHSHLALSRLAERRGRIPECLEHLHLAADLYRTMDAPQGLTDVLDEIARVNGLPSGAVP